MQYLHQKKCFFVLDGWEEVSNNNSPDYSDYCDFANRVAKESHRSCVLLLSRERPRDIEPLEGRFVRLQKLGSLTYEEEELRTILSRLEEQAMSQGYAGKNISILLKSHG